MNVMNLYNLMIVSELFSIYMCIYSVSYIEYTYKIQRSVHPAMRYTAISL